MSGCQPGDKIRVSKVGGDTPGAGVAGVNAHPRNRGSRFLGSHLVDALVKRGDEVVVLDDLSREINRKSIKGQDSFKAMYAYFQIGRKRVMI